MVGSIGAVIVHTEFSAAMEEHGVKATIIRSGDRKYRGSSMEPLDDPTLAKLQHSVDDARRRFAKLVSIGRNIAFKDVMATEADWFEGDEAVELGLMDAVLGERDAWGRLEEECDRIKRQKRNGQ
jgi:ClpP class serine protease